MSCHDFATPLADSIIVLDVPNWEHGGSLQIALTFGFGVTVGVWTVAPISGGCVRVRCRHSFHYSRHSCLSLTALLTSDWLTEWLLAPRHCFSCRHLNPAISFGFLVIGEMMLVRFVLYESTSWRSWPAARWPAARSASRCPSNTLSRWTWTAATTILASRCPRRQPTTRFVGRVQCSATTTTLAELLRARSHPLGLCTRGSSCIDSGARRPARGGHHHGDPRADGHVVVRLAPARHVRPHAANGGLLGDRLPLLRGALSTL